MQTMNVIIVIEDHANDSKSGYLRVIPMRSNGTGGNRMIIAFNTANPIRTSVGPIAP